MVTRRRAGRSRVRIPAGARDFSVVQNSGLAFMFSGYQVSLPVLEWPGRGVGQSPPSCAQFNNG